MSTILKNVLQFSGLAIGVPSIQAHRLNINEVPVIPELVAANAANFTITADATNVTVTRTASGGAAVAIYVEHWHSIEHVIPVLPPPGFIGVTPFIIASGDGGSGTISVIQDEGVAVAGAPHSTLNFVGAGVAATNAGAGVATITVNGTVGTVSDEGVPLAGAPHTTINAVGPGIVASNSGGGVATLTVNATVGTIQDEGAPLAGTPHTTLNFVGAGVVAANAGGGVATITVAGGTAGNTAYGYAVGQSDEVIGADGDVNFDLGGTVFPNAGFTSVPAPAGTTFVVATAGAYRYDFYVAGLPANNFPLEFVLRVNGVNQGPGHEFRSQTTAVATDVLVCRGSGIIQLAAAATVTLRNRTNLNTDTVTVTSVPPGGEAGANRTLTLTKLN